MAPVFASLEHFFLGSATSNPPFLLSFRSSTTLIVFTVCLAIFTDLFLYGLMVPVIPFSISVQAGIPDDEVQEWTAILLACYSGALFVGSPVAGFIADKTHTRRLPLLIGLVALAVSTLMLMLGTNIAALVVGRILQGLSAAVVWSVGLALLADTMGSKIGMAMGYVSIAMSAGLLVAPIIGGAVYENVGYYAVYYVAFGIIFFDIVLRLLLIEKKVALQWLSEEEPSTGPSESRIDAVPGEDIRNGKPADESEAEKRLSGNRGISPSQEETSGEESQTVPWKPKNPNIVLVRSKRTMATLYGIVVQAGLMMAFDTFLPLFVKSTFRWESTAAGLSLLPLFIPSMVSPVVGWASDRFGPKWPSMLGFVIAVPILICLRFVTQDTIGHKVLMCALLALLGVSLYFSSIPLMAEISYIIEDKERRHPGIFGKKGVYGIAYGLFNTFFALGGTIGSLVSGYLMEGPGWGTTMWVLGLWCASGGIVVGLWLGGGFEGSLKSRKKAAVDPAP
ncbi:major facilitator superfamily domain-containing protein [Zalerion maritima]|uniref:Major facilitator superfamily domain-containing protein n=1 Tax=Zalerion maritima TaxID=339359 RepID=A0AAD5RJ67_9PEZI|nr:major facilitator superfamily domain-containing protein [Zalerion maritima]